MRSLETIFGKKTVKNLDPTVKTQILINLLPNITFKMAQHTSQNGPTSDVWQFPFRKWYQKTFGWSFFCGPTQRHSVQNGPRSGQDPARGLPWNLVLSKRTWTCHKSHFIWKFTGNMPDSYENTSIKHGALPLYRSVWPLFGEKSLKFRHPLSYL